MRLRNVARVMPSNLAACTGCCPCPERFNDEFAFNGGQHLQFWIAFGDLEQLARERGGIGRVRHQQLKIRRRWRRPAGDFGGQVRGQDGFALWR